jgi:hypothetical protein
MAQKQYIPTVQVRENCLCLYEVPAIPFRGAKHELKGYKTYTGEVTQHAQKRIKEVVDIFLQRTPKRRIFNPVSKTNHDFRLSFLTLTISRHERVSGKEGHEALKVFLQHFRRPPSKKAVSEQLKSYLWKAELQERNQLHYHLTSDAFLHFGEVQRVWNGIQDRRGWLCDYRRNFGKSNPNSTDVHNVYKVKDLGAYLSKYLSKEEFFDASHLGFECPLIRRNIGAKTWDCSNNLKIKRFSDVVDEETNSKVLSAIRNGKARELRLEKCTIVQLKNPLELLSQRTKSDYQNWLT